MMYRTFNLTHLILQIYIGAMLMPMYRGGNYSCEKDLFCLHSHSELVLQSKQVLPTLSSDFPSHFHFHSLSSGAEGWTQVFHTLGMQGLTDLGSQSFAFLFPSFPLLFLLFYFILFLALSPFLPFTPPFSLPALPPFLLSPSFLSASSNWILCSHFSVSHALDLSLLWSLGTVS